MSEPSLSPYAGLAAKIRPEGSRDAQALAAEKAAREPVLRIALTPGFILTGWLFEPCRVLVDGQSLGRLRSAEKFEAPVAAGRHAVKVSRGWLSSQESNVEVGTGDIAQLLCRGHSSLLDLLLGLTLLFGVVLPGRFYWLTPFRR